ncbi:BON domain-containing protein [Flavobacterium sp. UBA7680]|uniref:BON domain-containing protein n=1 Tax=Flavobacterium sp. UBA7680 TaxID=1946559 RepID=UPI0025C207AA|nr:BON domain-containing protein [Flavobacterium sp. UBA7680]
MMKKNEILQRDVQDALNWEPELNTAQIQVSANNGLITLSGFVDLPEKKTKARNTAKQVPGVLGVLENIKIKTNSWEYQNDHDLAQTIIKAFKWNWNTVNDTIQVQVKNGHVTLTGELEWHYQKEGATKAVNNVIGVKGVDNNICIESGLNATITKDSIKGALQGHIAIDLEGIVIQVFENEVILEGRVDSRYQKELAAKIIWKTPGVRNVVNNLKIIHENTRLTLGLFYKQLAKLY